MALHGVAATGTLLRPFADESENGSTWCGGGWQPPTPPLCPGMHAYRCMSPTIAGESGTSLTRCGGSRHPLRSGSDACRCTPPTVAGESDNGSAWVWRHPAPPSVQALMLAGACLPPMRVGDVGQREHWLRSVWASDGTSFLKVSLKNLLLLLLQGRLFNLSP